MGKKSRMNREIHVRFCESLKGRFLRATRPRQLRGHFAYYGVSDNSKCIRNFAYQVMLTLFKWLNRRGKRGCYTWEKFFKLLKQFPLPKPRIMVNLLSTER